MKDVIKEAYITVNKDGIFVGGKPTTEYNGYEIYDVEYVKKTFVRIQQKNPQIEEFHIGAFLSAEGEGLEPGRPDATFGTNEWCRVKFYDGRVSPWVFNEPRVTHESCACYCAADCIGRACANASFFSTMVNVVIDKDAQKTESKTSPDTPGKQPDLKNMGLSKLAGNKMTTQEIEQHVIKILKDEYKLSNHKPYEKDVDGKTNIDDFEFDSLDLFELGINLPRFFGISMTEEECEKVVYATTVSDIVKLMQKKLEEKTQTPINPVVGAVNNNKQNKR